MSGFNWKIKAGEIIASSSEPKSVEEARSAIETEEANRKTIRENRLNSWKEMAGQDLAYQKKAIEVDSDLLLYRE